MNTIGPNIDAYGTYARAMALADIVEAQALRKPSVSIAELADYIRDNSWTRALESSFRGVPEENLDTDEEFDDLGEETDASDMASRRIFSILQERESILGPLYPFYMEKQRLHYRGGIPSQSSYLLLLAITIAHAYGAEHVTFNPRDLFEDLVASSFTSKGFLASAIGRLRRNMSLEEALDRVGQECRLSPNLGNAVVRRQAQEEGVDVIAHLDWTDSRPMHWVYIIQATCAMSNFWRQKLAEPSPAMWKGIFGLLVLPTAVLAIPHQIPKDMMHYLLQHASGGRLLVDRLRLATLNPALFRNAEMLGSFLDSLEVNLE